MAGSANFFSPNGWNDDMDKRDLSKVFRERLKMLLTRSDLN
ncbi:MAG: transcriptional regulator, partial [Mesorhizobium sp.]